MATDGAFNIANFRSNMGGKLATPSTFRVLFSSAKHGYDRSLAMLCNQAQFPARAFATYDYTTHGPRRKIAQQNVYDDLVLSIYCTEDMTQKYFFDSWQGMIYNENDFTFNYPDEYVADIIIEQFNGIGEVTYAVKVKDAYPMMINPLSLDWAQPNAFHNLQVTFAYHYWTVLPKVGASSTVPFSSSDTNELRPKVDITNNLDQTGFVMLEKNENIITNPIRPKTDTFNRFLFDSVEV